MQVYAKAEQAAMNYALRNAEHQTGVATPQEALRLADLDLSKVLVLYDGQKLLSVSKVSAGVYQLGREGLQYVGNRESVLSELARLSFPIRGALLSQAGYREQVLGQAQPLSLEQVADRLHQIGFELRYGFDDDLGFWASAGQVQANRCRSSLDAALEVCHELGLEVKV